MALPFRSKWMFILMMLLILASISFMLWLRYDAEIKHYDKLQHTLMQQQANQTAKDINNSLNFIRNQMSAISLDNTWLSDMGKFEHLTTVQESMKDRLRLYFPLMYAYSIASAAGEQLGGDIDNFLGDDCKADIKRVAGMFDPKVDYFNYNPYLHNKNGGCHFDVMIPILAQGNKMVFIVSLNAVILSRILKENLISKHVSFLVRKDIPTLIEVSSDRVRDKFSRDENLSDNEIKYIGAKADVPNSRWKVVVVENTSFIQEFKNAKQLDALMLFSIFLLLWVAIFWFGLRSQIIQGKLFSKLSHESQHDELTGLANRRKLFKEVGFSVDDVVHLNEHSAVLYMDLNGFKQVNDNYGHEVGDALLKEFANRLTHLTRQQDVVARMGGDEFVILLRNLGFRREEAHESMKDAVQRYRVALKQEYVLNDVVLSCLPSIGSVLIDAKKDKDDFINQADKNMYQDKIKNRNKEHLN